MPTPALPALSLPRKLDVLDQGELCIVGGGLAGVAAALHAAENGIDTVLIEQRGALGWEISHGLEIFLSGGEVPNRLKQIVETLKNQNAFRDGTLDPVAAECLFDVLLKEARVRFHFRVHAGALAANPRAVMVTTKSGPMAIEARAIIDATENARIARSGGAKFSPAPSKTEQTRAFLLCAVTAPAARETHAVPGVGEITLSPTLWPHEAHVMVRTAAASESAARFAIAKSIEFLRAKRAAFEKASLSLSSHEGFALNVPRVDAASLPEALFVAGPGAIGRKPSLEERVTLGEKAAAAAIEALRGVAASR
ncbi:MAG TPA: FAD-dependent oxidoreductase [Planctomycetota bacterium]|nr:FAD-dependent oxidoreductase [Planctomycetota bacterium]